MAKRVAGERPPLVEVGADFDSQLRRIMELTARGLGKQSVDGASLKNFASTIKEVASAREAWSRVPDSNLLDESREFIEGLFASIREGSE